MSVHYGEPRSLALLPGKASRLPTCDGAAMSLVVERPFETASDVVTTAVPRACHRLGRGHAPASRTANEEEVVLRLDAERLELAREPLGKNAKPPPDRERSATRRGQPASPAARDPESPHRSIRRAYAHRRVAREASTPGLPRPRRYPPRPPRYRRQMRSIEAFLSSDFEHEVSTNLVRTTIGGGLARITTRKPTGYASTFHKISTLPAPETKKTCPGDDQVQDTRL